MPIDITQDLNIDVNEISVETKTINNTYDSGTPGTYLPGIDCSATDNVSKGILTTYKIGIALSSKSGTTYPLDKLFAQVVEDPKTDGTGIVKMHYINTNNDCLDTTDDGLNTLVNGNNAVMNSVVLNGASGISSTSTINFDVEIKYNQINWKSKIMPNIRIGVVKDDITVFSNPISLSETRLSAKANLRSYLTFSSSIWSNIRLTKKDNVDGFYAPFFLVTDKTDIANVAHLTEAPIFSVVNYYLNLAYTIDSIPVTLNVDNIDISVGTGYTVLSKELNGTILKLSLQKNNSTSHNYPYITITPFIPYTKGSENSVNLNLTASFDTSSVPYGTEYTDFQNSCIFNPLSIGSITTSVNIPLATTTEVVLFDYVNGDYNLTDKLITNYISITNNNFIKLNKSKFLLVLQSEVSYFDDNTPSFDVSYYSPTGDLSLYTALPSEYTYKFGYVDTDLVTNYNTISKSILDGNVFLGTYQEIIDSGHNPNILQAEVVSEIFDKFIYDAAKEVKITFAKNNLVHINNADFKMLYESDPMNPFNSHLYLTTRLNTIYTTVAEAMLAHSTKLGLGDEFTDVNSNIMLYLATANSTFSPTLTRFGTTSTIRKDIPVIKKTSELAGRIMDDKFNYLTDVYNYGNTYYIGYFCNNTGLSNQGYGTFEAGTKITFSISENILKHMYITGNPTIRYNTGSGYDIVDTITNYQINMNNIEVTIPNSLHLMKDYYIMVPVRFSIISENLTFNTNPTIFDESKFILTDLGFITTGLSAATPFFDVNNTYSSTIIHGAGIDFSGLIVSSEYYENNKSTNFIATITNQVNNLTNIYMGLSVPTNRFNRVETSNNTRNAYIENITRFNPSSIIYYQTDAAVIQSDIDIMKEINIPGTNLQIYYDTEVINNWTLYNDGDTLPDDVVMLMAYTPDVIEGDTVRVDYEVLMDIPSASPSGTYINSGEFIYYSSASSIETSSNMVTIYNQKQDDVLSITKAPLETIVEIHKTRNFTYKIEFDIPSSATYDSLTFRDILPDELVYSTMSTIQIGDEVPVPLEASYSGKTVTKKLTDIETIAGEHVIINLVVSVYVPFIPSSLQSTNTASLIINDDETLITYSNTVNNTYLYVDYFEIAKAPISQTHPKINNEEVEFTITFNVSESTSGIYILEIFDQLDNSLIYNPTKSTIQFGTDPSIPLNATIDPNNLLRYFFIPSSSTYGKKATITLNTSLRDISLLPEDGIIYNSATIQANYDERYRFDSNTVNVIFIEPKKPVKKANTYHFKTYQDKDIDFKVAFYTDNVKSTNKTIVIEDIIDDILQLNDYYLDLVETPNITITDETIGNHIKFTIQTNYPDETSSFPNEVSLFIETSYIKDTIKKQNYIIKNQASYNIDSTLLNSNIVYIKGITKRSQAVIDIIESVALEQTALSHIINAEGEKLQKVIGDPIISTEKLLITNQSVQSMINSIARLELILQTKLDLFDNCLCETKEVIE